MSIEGQSKTLVESGAMELFLVCGLGSLGQHCVAALKEFGVKVVAVEQVEPKSWDIPNLPLLLDGLLVGDCRQDSILEQAQVAQCRAALLVTSSEQVNIEAALAIRQLNPHTRLVIRSAKENLNRLLAEQLGNSLAYEPTQLSTTAFALAALGTETLGFFNLDGQWLRVIQRQSQQGDRWCNTRQLHELNTRRRRLLAHAAPGVPLPQNFHQWQPDATVQAGDTLVYIETAEPSFDRPAPLTSRQSGQWWRRLAIPHLTSILQKQLGEFWQLSLRSSVRRVALACGLSVLALLLVGMGLFLWSYRGLNLLQAFYLTAILLLGGYGDIFGNIQEVLPIPWWLQVFSLAMTVAGTVLVGVLYALLTEALLSAKFQLAKRRPPVPLQGHAVIIGLGRVGQQVAALLQRFQQPLVGVSLNGELESNILPEIPLIVGKAAEALPQANLPAAKSVVVITDDEILNLEIALMSQSANPDCFLVIRTSGQRLRHHLRGILPQAQVLGVNSVAAEVFAGAAFGENISHIFRFNNQTVLVTEYQVEAGDTLNHLLLAEVACGYGVVPLLYQRPPQPSRLMPSDDIKLEEGDRLLVLATLEGLQRIEVGNRYLPSWQIGVERAINQDAAFESANAIARISGCPLITARELMKNLPGTLDFPLYQLQGQRLVRELGKLQTLAHLSPR